MSGFYSGQNQIKLILRLHWKNNSETLILFALDLLTVTSVAVGQT